MNAIKWIPSLIFGLVFFPAPSHACSCTEPITVEQHLQDREAIFVGRALEVSPWQGGTSGCDFFLVRFNKVDSWKGDLGTFIEVLTEQDPEGCCGFSFEIGESYLVYGDDSPHMDKFHTHSCIGTKHVSEASPEIDLLEALTPVEGVSWGWLKAVFP